MTMTRSGFPVVRAAWAAALLASVGAAASAQTTLTTELVASGFSAPLYVTHAPGDDSRLFVVQQRGLIRIIDLDSGSINPTPFIDLSGIVSQAGNERGLLGLAFDPDYASNGYFYVNYTNNAGDTRIRRYQVSSDPDIADALTATPVMAIAQTDSNHNGGWIGFGPDGYLYIASGDGGGSYDPNNAGQRLNTLLGKMLRIDIDGDDFPTDNQANYAVPDDNPFTDDPLALDEIWAYGLRNPWRPSFDRATGDLWIADVGQQQREEVNFQSASSPGGENYGWRLREGFIQTPNVGGSRPADNVDPIHDYTHAQGCSITGGYVYRGCAIPDLQGAYFFADFCSTTIWTLRYDAVAVSDLTDRTAELDPPGSLAISSITSFGEDAQGNLYIVDRGGEVFRIVAADGSDACPCPADLTGSSDPNDPSYGVPDGDADGDDFFFYLDAFTASDTPVCDLTGSSDPNEPSFGTPDGDCDGDDFFFYLDLFLACE
ncbi:MAG: PQQ-dependent sugar dehydrogenase [Phycisphaerales bacterium JB037]